VPPGVQRPHDDYPIESQDQHAWWKEDDVPLNVLIPLETDGRVLGVWPGGIKDTESKVEDFKEVHIPAGSALLFRGDLLHCGMGSAYENRCIHFYLHQPSREGGRAPEDGTSLCDDAFLKKFTAWRLAKILSADANLIQNLAAAAAAGGGE